MNTTHQGRQGEAMARAYLARRGYEVEATNVKGAGGEVDVIARDGDVLCAVEVRSVSTDEYGGAAATVTRQKQYRIGKAFRLYLEQRVPRWHGDVRCDVLAVQWHPDGRPDLDLIQNAFDVYSW